MSARTGILMAALSLSVWVGAPSWGADDRDPFDRAGRVVNGVVTPAGERQVATDIAKDLNIACHCAAFSAASVTAQRSGTQLGWGEILIADRLAVAISAKTGVSLSTAMAEVMASRQQGMGWGQIAHAQGLNLGSLVSSVEKSAKAVADAAKGAASKGLDKGAASAAGAGPGGGHGGGQAEGGHGADGGGHGSEGGGKGGGKGG